MLDLPHPVFRIAAVPQFDHRRFRKLEAEEVNLARLGCPAFTAAGAVDVAVPHVCNRHVLPVAAGVFVSTIAGMLAVCIADQLPALRFCLSGMTCSQTNTAAQFVPTSRRGLDTCMLPAIGMAAGQLVKAVASLTFWVRS